MQHLARQHSGKKISNFDDSRRVSGRTVNRVGILTALCSGGLCGDQIEEAIADVRLRRLLSSVHHLNYTKLLLTNLSGELRDLFQLEDPRETMMMRVITQSPGSLSRCLHLLSSITILVSTRNNFMTNTTGKSILRSIPCDDEILTLFFRADITTLCALLDCEDVLFMGIGSRNTCVVNSEPGEMIMALREYGYRYVNLGVAPYLVQVNDSVVTIGISPFSGQCYPVGESQDSHQYVITKTGHSTRITSLDELGEFAVLDVNEIHHFLV